MENLATLQIPITDCGEIEFFFSFFFGWGGGGRCGVGVGGLIRYGVSHTPSHEGREDGIVSLAGEE